MKTNIITTPMEEWNQPFVPPMLIAGPCSAESELQMLSTARSIATISKHIIFRAGIWKPRTRPNCFEGMGSIGLEWMKKVKRETGLRTATEVANAKHVEECLKNDVDIIWIGARTTVNPFSVQEIADAVKGTEVTVMVKNPVNPDIQLWLGAMERINYAGIKKICAIHRGFHAHGHTIFRNDPLWEITIELKTLHPELPIICDPSHICGNTELISYISQKALDMDMQGLMIETHCNPSLAKSDAKQQLTPLQLKLLMEKLVLRKASSPDLEFKSKLEELRDAIDQTDDKLMQLLLNRMQIAEKIGTYKKQNKVTVLQSDRWKSLLNERLDRASLMGLNEEFIKTMYVLIHKESIRHQTEIMNK